jgi:hypothetical protein
MPYDSGSGSRSCLSLLSRLDRISERELVDQLRRHATTCRCLKGEVDCPPCSILLGRWLGVPSSPDSRQAA